MVMLLVVIATCFSKDRPKRLLGHGPAIVIATIMLLSTLAAAIAYRTGGSAPSGTWTASRHPGRAR